MLKDIGRSVYVGERAVNKRAAASQLHNRRI